jgi:prepilin-type processing-associated H-X9-DG protein
VRVNGAPDPSWAWSTFILPYIEQTNLYNRLSPDVQTMQTVFKNDLPALQTIIPIYICPTDINTGLNDNRKFSKVGIAPPVAIGLSNYPGNGGNAGDTGIFQENIQQSIATIRDGTSNTIAIGERKSSEGAYAALWAGLSQVAGETVWGASGSGQTCVRGYTYYRIQDGVTNTGVTYPDAAFSSLHPGGANFCLCDGSVRFVSNSMSWTNPSTSNKAQFGTYNKLGDRNDGQALGSDF